MQDLRDRDTEIASALAGDVAAVERLVRAHQQRLVRFGGKVCRDESDASDAIQEAFMRLAKRPDVLASPSALSWLMTVIRHACARMLRPLGIGHQELLDEHLPAPSDANPGVSLEREELVLEVRRALLALDAPSREVLVLRELEGLSGEDVAAQLGLSLAAVKSRLHRAREALRAELKHTDRH